MLTPEEVKALKLRERVYDLVSKRWVYTCSCGGQSRSKLSYVRNHPSEFSKKGPT